MKIPTLLTIVSAVSLACTADVAGAQAKQQGGGMLTLGAQVATRGIQNGVTACAGCHGAQGEGNAAAGFPRLAGQPHAYLVHQLKSYVDGSRTNAVMAPIAKQMTPQQIDAVAAYYAGLSAPVSRAASPSSMQALKRGQTLATVGDEKLGVQGCANCHGPGGAGEPPNYPYLAGQSAGYLSAALTEWKSGARHTDPSTQMNIIAKRLSGNDIAALAAFYSAQPAPVPETQRIATPARAGQAGTSAHAAAAPSMGIGTEQGQPSSGGSQGAGGGGAASGPGSPESGTKK